MSWVAKCNLILEGEVTVNIVMGSPSRVSDEGSGGGGGLAVKKLHDIEKMLVLDPLVNKVNVLVSHRRPFGEFY